MVRSLRNFNRNHYLQIFTRLFQSLFLDIQTTKAFRSSVPNISGTRIFQYTNLVALPSPSLVRLYSSITFSIILHNLLLKFFLISNHFLCFCNFYFFFLIFSRFLFRPRPNRQQRKNA